MSELSSDPMSDSIPGTPPDQLSPGQIRTLEVWDFVSIEHAKFEFGPEMNQVCGPNGSGKLAMVLAIYFGLGGLFTERPIADIVMDGKTEFKIELAIKNHSTEPDILIHRTSKSDGRLTQWMVDGKSSEFEEVKTLLSHFNIDTGSKFDFVIGNSWLNLSIDGTPQALLALTLKSQPRLGLYQGHENLVKINRAKTELTLSIAALKADIEAKSEQVRSLGVNGHNRINSFTLSDEAASELLIEATAALEDARQELSDDEIRLEVISQRMSREMSRWSVKLTRFIDQLSDVFHDSLHDKLGFYGKVKVQQHEKVDEWGLIISASTSDHESLRTLSTGTFSGGEWQVLMFFFLMSLHRFTDSPIRIFDHINGNADPSETVVMQNLCVDTARSVRKSQCFYTTAKIYPGWRPSPRMMGIMLLGAADVVGR